MHAAVSMGTLRVVRGHVRVVVDEVATMVATRRVEHLSKIDHVDGEARAVYMDSCALDMRGGFECACGSSAGGEQKVGRRHRQPSAVHPFP